MLLIQSAHPGLAEAGTVIYAGLAFACAGAYWSTHRKGLDSGCWLVLTVLQAFFAADAFFGLRLALAEAGREFFQHRGWYADRRPIQAVLSAAAYLISVFITWRFTRHIRQGSEGSRMAIAGTGLLAALFLLSAVSWHLLDSLMSWPSEPFSLGVVIRIVACGLTGRGVWQELTSVPN